MKKHLMTLALLGLTAGTTVQAQGFSYSFEGDYKADGWEVASICTEEGGTWQQIGTRDLSDGTTIAPHEGDKQMMLMWKYADQDEWLKSPKFTCPNAAKLTFWTWINYKSDHGDSYSVMVSDDGGSTYKELWRVAGANKYEEVVTVDLGAYAGKEIRLAWRGKCEGGLFLLWLIDDIRVSGSDGNILLYEDFESGTMPEGWTTKDYDGDGKTWDATFLYGNAEGHNGSKGMISSASYMNDIGVLTPRNDLITPRISGASKIRFFVKAQDEDHFAEHFGVEYTKDKDGSQGWRLVSGSEETLTVGREWQERTYNLPEGTEYVSFFHFDCTDQFWLCIDDVTVYGKAVSGIAETTATDVPAEATGYYDLSGRRIDAPQKGVYIVKMSDGKNKKVVKK